MSKSKIFIFFSVFFLISTSLISTFSFAQKLDHAYIQQFAHDYLQRKLQPTPGNKLSIEVMPIDPRIKIQPCDEPLTANIPEKKHSRNITLKITCNNSTPWWLFIQARIKQMQPIVVASEYINKGELLTQDNIKLIFKPSYQIRQQGFSSLAAVVGSKASRNITKGSKLTKRKLCTVCSKDPVTIEANIKGLSIKTEGLALANGALGDTIRVKNKQSGKIISARVVAANKVKVFL